MTDVKYSIVLVNKDFKDYKDSLSTWVYDGVKILWFGNKNKKREVEEYLATEGINNTVTFYFLEAFSEVLEVVDGKVSEQTKTALEIIAKETERTAGDKKASFNVEQYWVEHSLPENDLIIMAGAGTGKTTVMIDRVMFLMHMVEGISFSDFSMITFTNEATSNMRHKVQKKLLAKYKESKNVKYLEMLESVCDLNICTIHSFSKKLLGEMGSIYGYSNRLSLRGFTYEKMQIVRDLLNEFYVLKGAGNVKMTIGIPIYEMEKLVLKYWAEMNNIGLTDEQIKTLDWGTTNTEDERIIQEALQYVFAQVETRYTDIKHKEDAIEVTDIIRELHRLLETDGRLVSKIKPIKYLFVDEFQDTDNVQIQMIAALRYALGLRLFVVGDIKQSIYRFRGATDIAFDSLKRELERNYGIEDIKEYELTKNYRTSSYIMDNLDVYFSKWKDKKLLSYEKPLQAMETMQGEFRKEVLYTNKYDESKQLERQSIILMKDALQNIGNNSDRKAYVLTRTNWQLGKIKDWCEDNGIPCNVRKQGGFFQCNAVVDFIDMVAALLYHKEPVYLYNYIDSSYCKFSMQDIHEQINALSGDKKAILNCLEDVLRNNTKWDTYLKEIRLKPILYVIRSVIEDAEPIKQYAIQRKQELVARGWNRDEANQQIIIDAEQYRLDLDKLMQMIRDHFSGDFASLEQIYEYLTLRNKTDTQENQEEVSLQNDISCIYGITVHASKGLEFDTVIIPFTNALYVSEKRTEVILEKDGPEVTMGWNYYSRNMGTNISNSNYKAMKETEQREVGKEETRLLYVAMTRAIRRLLCIEIANKKGCWSELLTEE